MAAPWVLGVAVLVGAALAWWFKSQQTKGEKAGFLAKLEARDERLLLASEQVIAARKLMEDANIKYAELASQQQQGAPAGQIAITTSALGDDLARVTTANSELYTTLGPSALSYITGEMARLADITPSPPRTHKYRKPG
jgi:hypothetical protein